MYVPLNECAQKSRIRPNFRKSRLDRSGGKAGKMFIKYDYTADGKPIMVEVTEEVAEFLKEDKRLTRNAKRREDYHCPYHIEAIDYEGEAFAYHETPEKILLRKEQSMTLWKAMEELSDTQFRRLVLYSEGMTYREIAALEGKDFSSVAESIRSAQKKAKKILSKHPHKTALESPYSEED